MAANSVTTGAAFVLGAACLVAAAANPATPPAAGRVRIDGCRVKFAEEVALASERTGVLRSVADVGSMVDRGDVVARLNDAVYRASLAIAERDAANDVEVRFASKAAELAQLKYQRAGEANRSAPGAVSELELRELQLSAEKARLQAEQAAHRYAVAGLRRDEARAQLETLALRAPTPAVVRAVHRSVGEVVRQGEVVAELVNTTAVRIEGNAPLSAAPLLRAGRRVSIAIDRRGGTLDGVVRFVDVKIEPVSQTIRFTVEASNQQGLLREGMTASVVVGAEP